MDSIKLIKTSVYNVYKNLAEYLKSILILQAISFIITAPIITFIFHRLLKRLGLSSITENDFTEIFKSPVTIGMLLVLILVFLFFVYYEIGYYFLLAHYQNTEKNYTFRGIIKDLNKKAKYFLSFQAIYFFVYFLLILPLASLGLNAGLIKGIRIPNFITDELLKNQYGIIIYVLFIVAILYFSLRLIFAVPFFVIEKDITIKEAVKRSFKESRGKLIKTFFTLLLIIGLHTLVMALFVIVLFVPIILVELISSKLAPFFAAFLLTVIQWFLFIGYGLLQVIISEAIYILAFKKENGKLKVNLKKDKDKIIKNYKKPFIFSGNKPIVKKLIVIFLISISIYNYFVITEPIYLPKTKILAHRGYIKGGVENSIGSLKAAAKFNPDYVELDIQETKDNEFVVFHDSDLSRLAGRDETIKDLTLEEIKNIDIKAEGFTDKIPSLKEFIRVSKELGVNLLVEIKPTGNESTNMVENLVNLLKEEGVHKDYLVQSLDEETILKVKRISPEIKTGYVIGFNIGSLPKTEADFIVMEEFSINNKILKEAREKEKDLFVWTVNEEDLIRKYLNLNVDGIITDIPGDAVEIRNSFEEEKTLLTRLRWILNN